MRSFTLRSSLTVASITLSVVAFRPCGTLAQWHADSTTNTPVCTAAGQQDMPKGCSDGADGAIFVWEDARSSTYQIYAQHLDASGHATWAANGVKLATLSRGNYTQTNPIVASDDSGGAYVIWSDGRFGSSNGVCLFAQHIRSDGSLAYADSGLAVAIGLNGCANPALCDDGQGNAYVTWEDNRSATVSSRPDIWMNRLWPGGVKFGLTITGSHAVESSTYNWYTKKYTYTFSDTSANFPSYLINQTLVIPGKGSYLIAGVPSPTQLQLKTYPSNGTYAYYIAGLTGMPLDTFQSKQTAPAIVSDGTGGCYVAWTSSGAVPNAIFATRVDSNGVALWDPAPGPGFLIYQSQNPLNPSKNVWINRDGNQLLLTWEVTNSENNSQEVYAQRMRNSTPYDTAFEWGTSAVDVSSDQILDQTSPRIYSDDSMVLGTNGAMVPFLDAEPSSGDDLDIAAVRILGDGGNLVPPATTGFWFFEQKPHSQSGYRTVKITDDSDGGTRTGVLAVWNDAWDGVDTMVYAQRIDRNGRRYFPAMGTANRWGLAISGDSSPTRRWNAKQVCLVPRDNGGIAAWTDFRNGNADIYAQLILNDGTASIPTDLTPPVDSVLSRSGSFDGSLCNTRCTDLLAVDTGAVESGISSITVTTPPTNMKLTVPNFTSGANNIPFSVCVIDSMLDGSASVSVTDGAGNKKVWNFSYCTIQDTLPPVITWNFGSDANWVSLHVSETRPWDRGLGSLTVSDTVNVTFTPPLSSFVPGSKTVSLIVSPTNALLNSSFIIQASDTNGNRSTIDTFTRSVEGVSSGPNLGVLLSVYPNPMSGASLFTLIGASQAEVSIFDMLGREVGHFTLKGSQEWNPSALPAGSYLARATIGGTVITKRLIRE